MKPVCHCWLAGLLASAPTLTSAHEEGAPFSGAILDPVILHHAHIENEQRLNFFVLKGMKDEAGAKHTGYESELELAYGSDNYKYGFEVFIPFLNIAAPEGEGRVTGVGDMEVRPLKYALLMKPDFIISTASGFGLPTGRKSEGLGEGNVSFTQYLFGDKAFGNWSITANLGIGGNLNGEADVWADYGVGLAYSFIPDVGFREVAPVRPEQKWVLAPSLELVGEHSFRSTDLAHTTSIAPAISLWHVASGWQLRAGVLLPIAGGREADAIFTIQIGNHLNWRSLLGGRGKAEG